MKIKTSFCKKIACYHDQFMLLIDIKVVTTLSDMVFLCNKSIILRYQL